MSVTVNQSWSEDKAKNLQKMLNYYGFKDDMGNTLAEDGIAGPKTQQALAKMNMYQQHLTKPDASTAAWQEQLNDWGYTNTEGKQLKVDGVYGPKTDAATSSFENGFFDGFTEGANTKKAVPTQTYPLMPKANDSQIIAAVTPDYNTPGYEWQQTNTAAGKYGYAPLSGGYDQTKQPNAAGTQLPLQELDYSKEAGVTGGFSMGGLMRDQMTPPDLSGIDYSKPLSSEDQNKVRQAIEIAKQQQAIDTLNMNEAEPKYEQAKTAGAPDISDWQKKYMDSMDAVTQGQRRIDDYFAKMKAGTAQPQGDPEAGQKNMDGTWKIIAQPGFTGSQSITSTLDEDEQTRLNSELMAKEYLKTHTVNDNISKNDIERIFKASKRDVNGNLIINNNADDVDKSYVSHMLDFPENSNLSYIATYATEQEKLYYFALKQEFGEKAAKDYYDSLQQTLNTRMGVDNASKMLTMPDGPLKNASIILQSIMTGISDYGTGWQQYFSNLTGNTKAVPDSSLLKEYDKISPTLDGPMKSGSEFARDAGGVIPDILLLLATKGLGVGTDAVESIAMENKGMNVPKLLKIALKSLMEPQTYGTAYKEAKESGFTDDQAQTYGVLYTSIDSILGNLGNLKKGEDLTKNMTKRIMNDPGIVQDIVEKIKETNKDVTKDYLKGLFLDQFRNNGTGTQNYTDEYIYQLILNSLKEKLSD